MNTLLQYNKYCVLCILLHYALRIVLLYLCVENAFPFALSDGMSRSCVFITCMCEIERVKVEGGVDIFHTVKAARAQRPHMVNTSVSDGPRLCNPNDGSKLCM